MTVTEEELEANILALRVMTNKLKIKAAKGTLSQEDRELLTALRGDALAIEAKLLEDEPEEVP